MAHQVINAVALRHDAEITLSTVKDRLDGEPVTKTRKVSDLYRKLSRPVVGTETLETYLKMSRDQQTVLKDVGGFLSGGSTDGRRSSRSIVEFGLLVLDIDRGDDTLPLRLECSEVLSGVSWCIHSTRKHVGGDGEWRLRLVVPLSRVVSALEHQYLIRRLASEIDPGMLIVDPSSEESNRLMFWPSVCSDGEAFFRFNDAPLFDVDALGWVAGDEWKNTATWPRWSGENSITVTRDGERRDLKDPGEKRGIVGAFCRVVGLEMAVDQYLPDIYRDDGYAGRRSFIGGEGSNGLILYEDGYAVSMHSNSDPVAGRGPLCAFDLVRIHKFGALDEGMDGPDVNPASLPSHDAMVEFALGIPEVSAEMGSVMDGLLLDIENALTSEALERVVSKKIREADVSSLQRNQLAVTFQRRMHQITQVKPPIGTIRNMLAPVVITGGDESEDGVPGWAKGLIFITALNVYWCPEHHFVASGNVLEVIYGRHCPRRVLADGTPGPRMTAHEVLSPVVPLFHNVGVHPGKGASFRDHEDRRIYNMYKPVEVAAVCGADLQGRILTLLEEQYPETWRMVIDWCAWVYQNPGERCNWSLFIFGKPGGGKTWLSFLMAKALGPSVASVLDNNEICKSNFNEWALEGCFGVLEECRIEGTSKYDVWNRLKPIITNDVIRVTLKGKKSVSVANHWNLMLLSNYYDALPLDDTDRRIACVENHLDKDSKTKEFWSAMHHDCTDRITEVRAMLRDWQISPGFSGGGSAPMTTEKQVLLDINGYGPSLVLKDIMDGHETIPGYAKGCLIYGYLMAAMEERGHTLNDRQLCHLLRKNGFTPITQMMFNGEKRHRVWSREKMSVESLRSILEDSLAQVSR